jgi:4-hydroxybenzoate polyprenyltransferase
VEEAVDLGVLRADDLGDALRRCRLARPGDAGDRDPSRGSGQRVAPALHSEDATSVGSRSTVGAMPGTGSDVTTMPVALVRASHPQPGLAVTVLAVALAAFAGMPVDRVAILAVAVLSGQLVVGWTNDLVDARVDRRAGRDEKPIASGAVSARVVTGAAAVTGVVCAVFSLLCGPAAAAVHLVLGVGAAIAYNLGVKATILSWLPYAVAFGALPVAVGLTLRPAELPPIWVIAVAALLGVGAHLLNVYPDLEADAATGIRGLPQRLGRRGIPLAATGILTLATVVAVIGVGLRPWHWVALAGVVVAAVFCRRAPLTVTVMIAAVDLAIVATA